MSNGGGHLTNDAPLAGLLFELPIYSCRAQLKMFTGCGVLALVSTPPKVRRQNHRAHTTHITSPTVGRTAAVESKTVELQQETREKDSMPGVERWRDGRTWGGLTKERRRERDSLEDTWETAAKWKAAADVSKAANALWHGSIPPLPLQVRTPSPWQQLKVCIYGSEGTASRRYISAFRSVWPKHKRWDFAFEIKR